MASQIVAGDARAVFVARADRRRLGVSLGMTLGACLVLAGAAALVDWLWPREIADAVGVVRVRLGVAAGIDSQVPHSPEAVEQTLPSMEDTPPAPVEPAEAVPAAETAPVAAATLPEAADAPANAAPAQVAEPAPARASTPAASPAQPATTPRVPTPVPQVQPSTNVVKGNEAGFSHETVFGSPGAEVGRNFYAPIPDYLPPPLKIPATVRDRIPAAGSETVKSRQAWLDRFYTLEGSTLVLTGKVDPGLRPKLWAMLRDGGYDEAAVEWRQGRLGQVALKFTVEGGGAGAIRNVRLTSSSGNPEIDEAVLFGFRNSSFYNNTAKDLNGTFTYRFD